MKLTPINADFKHDGQQYWAGELRKLTPELHGYFTAAGWAGEAKQSVSSEPVTLEVQTGKHGLKSSSLAE